MKGTIIQLLPNIGLVGGTAAKVRILAQQSDFRQVICYAYNPKNRIYLPKWECIDNAILVEKYSLSNPLKNAFLLVRLCNEYDATVIHAYFPIDSFSSALAKILYPKIRIVRSFEGALHYSKWKRILQKCSFLFHNHHIAISNYIKNFYRGIFGKYLKNIQTVYNCPAFESHDNVCKHSSEHQYLLSIGGMNPTKNTETMIEAVKLLKDKGVNVQYHILGDGPLRQKIESMISEYHLENNVFLHGFRNDVKDFLSQCSVYVHPANLEGFGMAVVEAMSYKCPIIVSNSCALPELIVNGESGFVVSTYDAQAWCNKIEELLSNQNKMDYLGDNAHERFCSYFSTEIYVKTLDTIYSKLSNI